MHAAILSQLPKQQFNLNQFGGALGGAIQKDKTFFFVDYQGKAAAARHSVQRIDSDAGDGGRGLLASIHWAWLAGLGPVSIGTRQCPTDFGNINSPYTFGPFQCDGSGNPLPPNPTVAQAGGSQLQQDSGQHV